MNTKKQIKTLVIILFGLILPSLLLYQAYSDTDSLVSSINNTTTTQDLINQVGEVKKYLGSSSDYALFSLMLVEHTNYKTMTNKQVMKSTIIKIGFAVISIGLMLVILGIQEGGAKGGIEFGGISFDIQTGSTGVAVFMVGAIMATMGGVLKNKYQASTIPTYGGSSTPFAVEAYNSCQKTLKAQLISPNKACWEHQECSSCTAEHIYLKFKEELK